ncbi:hypothetical protein Pint_01568 [Pistacia integerrima]|uniref:Uncharacterized protein n=1 Tax=Pistacia integerrima TaxID=434235 RepID=A0ACC0ZMG6_9ROSI|nr:hypothetical protein Pint_01568 [Pistacia integerrima]
MGGKLAPKKYILAKNYECKSQLLHEIKIHLCPVQNFSPKPRPAQDPVSNKDAANKEAGDKNIAAQTFTFRELATATKNFRQECLIGEGGFGRVYKGKLEKSGQAQPVFREPNRYPQLVDPLIEGQYPVRAMNQAVAVAAMCLQEEPGVRPLITDVVTALSFLGNGQDSGTNIPPNAAPLLTTPPVQEMTSDVNGDEGDYDDIQWQRRKEVAEAIQWGTNSRHVESGCASASSL